MTASEREIYKRGVADAQAALVAELLEEHTDKLPMIRTLFAKGGMLAGSETDSARRQLLLGFSAGARAAYLILKNRGSDSITAFKAIMNPTVTFEVTPEDFRLYGYRAGH